MPTTVTSAINEIFLALGFQFPATTTPDVRESSVVLLNQSVQELAAATGAASWLRSTLTVSTSNGVSSYALPSGIQSVTGPCQTSAGRLLSPVSSRGEHTLATAAYATASTPAPAFWWVLESVNLAPGSGQANTHTLHLSPTPTGVVTLLLDVLLTIPHYTWQDYLDETPLPCPQDYAELYLFPTLRRVAAQHVLYLPRSQDVAAAHTEYAARAADHLTTIAPDRAPPAAPRKPTPALRTPAATAKP